MYVCVCVSFTIPPSSSLLQPFHGPWMRRKHLLFASETNVFHFEATSLEVPPDEICCEAGDSYTIRYYLPIKIIWMGEASINLSSSGKTTSMVPITARYRFVPTWNLNHSTWKYSDHVDLAWSCQANGWPPKIGKPEKIGIWLVVSTPLKNMKVSWDDYS